MSLKKHQCNALFIAAGFLLGMITHYYFFKSNIDYRIKQAYQEGELDATHEIIYNLNNSDSIVIYSDHILFFGVQTDSL